MFRSVIALFYLAVFAALPAFAHKVTTVKVVTDVDSQKQTYTVNLEMDIESSGDAAIDDSITPTQAAESFAAEALVIYFDKTEVTDHTTSTEIRVVSDEDTPEELKRTKANVVLAGKIPKGATNFLLYVDEDTEASVVMVYVKDGKPARRMQVMYPGDFSRPNNVLPITQGDPVEKGTSIEPAVSENSTNETNQVAEENPTAESNVLTQVKSGLSAIFSHGTIHWLFVLGLLLLSLRMRAITLQVAAFVMAHSLGLALAAMDLVVFPEMTIAILIGLGLIYVGVENFILTELKPWRPPVIFAFGIFHGAALAENYSGESIVELIGFNLGIEVALIAVLMVALIVLNILVKQEWYRKIIVQPANVLLIVAGIYWAFVQFA